MNTITNSLLSVRQLFSLIGAAIRGQEYDYTSGSLRKAIVLLAVPMVLEMAMESIFAVVDIFFVSGLGANAVAVVGLTEAVITLIYAIAIGFSMAVTAVVARRIGEKDNHGASITSAQVLIIGFFVALLVAIGSLLYADAILMLMGADDNVITLGKNYTSIMLGGCLTIIYLFIIAAIFRGAGNAIIAMRALWIANGINIVLDPCLIYGYGPFPELGVTGAAIATNIGRGIGALYLLYHLFLGDQRIQLRLHQLKFNSQVALNLLKVSIGGVLQFFIATASWVFLMRIVAQFGSESIAGYTIAIRVALFTFLPAWGLSNATATLVGQNLGAKNATRAEQSVWKTAKYNVIFMLAMGLFIFSFPNWILHVFTTDPIVTKYGVNCLRIIALGYGFFAIGMILTQAFNGSGDTNTPTWINFICFWLIQIPFAYIAANNFNWQTYGVAVSVTLAETLIAAIAYWQFTKGKWKLRKV